MDTPSLSAKSVPKMLFISNSMIATTLLLLVIFIQDISVLTGGNEFRKESSISLITLYNWRND